MKGLAEIITLGRHAQEKKILPQLQLGDRNPSARFWGLKVDRLQNKKGMRTEDSWQTTEKREFGKLKRGKRTGGRRGTPDARVSRFHKHGLINGLVALRRLKEGSPVD